VLLQSAVRQEYLSGIDIWRGEVGDPRVCFGKPELRAVLDALGALRDMFFMCPECGPAVYDAPCAAVQQALDDCRRTVADSRRVHIEPTDDWAPVK